MRLHRLLPVLAALPALAAAPGASAAPRLTSVRAAVDVRNAMGAPLKTWSVQVRLAARTRLGAVTGARPDRRRGVVTLRPAASTAPLAGGARARLRLTVRGRRAPSGWKLSGQPCTARPAGRRGRTARVAVTCVARPAEPATPGGGPGGAPGASPGSPGDGPDSGPGSPPGPAGPPSTGAPAARPLFAPYADVAGWPPPDLSSARTGGGVAHVSLGFVTAEGATKCAPTWGGYAAYPAAGASPYQRSEIEAYRAAGGDVIVSFGGAAGSELATRCGSVATLAKAYGDVVDAYGVTRLDFDVEGAAASDTAANTRRAQAIAQLQRTRPLIVSYTLAILPTGLEAEGRALVRSAIDNGVAISVVNGMAMDYGSGAAPSPSGRMGDYATQAGEALRGQLAALYPALPAAEVASRVGLTPMIGINDVPSEVFTLDDARKLAAWAAAQRIGFLGMWSLGRDRQCPSPSTTTQESCSGVAQSPWDFSKALGSAG